MRILSLPVLLLAAGSILTLAMGWVAVSTYRGAKPVAEQNLTGIALSLAEAIETIAAKDPSLQDLGPFRTKDLAYFTLIDHDGKQVFHSNSALIGLRVADDRYRGVFAGSGVSENRLLLKTGEEVFEMNTPFHLAGRTLALRLVLHTYRADHVVRRAQMSLLTTLLLLTVAWLLGISLYGYARRDEHRREEMARQERLAHLGEMGAVLAHEIRNPLAGIKGYAQLLQEQVQGGAQAGYLDLIVSETLRLEELVNTLMAYARQEQTQHEPVDLSALLEFCITLVRPEAEAGEVALRYTTLPGLTLNGIRNGLAQVLLNILKNGLQAMPDGGVLTIETHRTTTRAVITIEDTGPGIPLEDRDRIFEPFHTTRPRGTGLGLAVCRKIVEEHGGRIIVGGEPGTGARFTITLPLAGKG